jgi:hypothetical protein
VCWRHAFCAVIDCNVPRLRSRFNRPRETTRNLSQESRSVGRDLNPEKETGVLTSQPLRFVFAFTDRVVLVRLLVINHEMSLYSIQSSIVIKQIFHFVHPKFYNIFLEKTIVEPERNSVNFQRSFVSGVTFSCKCFINSVWYDRHE